MLFLHRGYFARAMLDHPEMPARSPFSPSFLAAYATAISLLRRLRMVFDIAGERMLQFWSCWAHALAAGVSVYLFTFLTFFDILGKGHPWYGCFARDVYKPFIDGD